jgi:hypothetical protein
VTYTVTCKIKDDAELLEVDFESIDAALEHARSSFAKGMRFVAISDGRRNKISGAELEACCRGVKVLTNDLIAF